METQKISDATAARPNLTVWQCYRNFWAKWTFRGRSSRKEYFVPWFFHSFIALMLIILLLLPLFISSISFLHPPLWYKISQWFIIGFFVIQFIPSLCVGVRRLHDQGLDGSYWLKSEYPFRFFQHPLPPHRFILMCTRSVNDDTNPWHTDI